MKIYIDGTACPEDADHIVAETRVGLHDVKVYKDQDATYWIVEDNKLINTVGLSPEQVMTTLAQLLEQAMFNKCNHR